MINRQNRCTGLYVWYCAGTKKNVNEEYVSRYQLWSSKKERQVKRDISYFGYEIVRGKEWVEISASDFKDMIVGDIDERNRMRRIDHTLLREGDRIVRIEGHRKKRNNHLEYLVFWSRPGEDRRGMPNHRTWETLRKIRSFQNVGGKNLINTYRRTNNITSRT